MLRIPNPPRLLVSGFTRGHQQEAPWSTYPGGRPKLQEHTLCALSVGQYNKGGAVLRAWVMRHNFRRQWQPGPACTPRSGNSRVDMILVHLATASVISMMPVTPHSYHTPIRSLIALSSPSSMDHIPLSYIRNPPLQARIRHEYRKSLTPIIKNIERADKRGQLEDSCGRFQWAVVDPLARLCR